MERLQKLIASAGLCSRRKAEELILAGKVTVNGCPAALGDSADPDRDTVCVEGVPVPKAAQRTVIVLNKPAGYVTTMQDEKGRKCVSNLVKAVPARVYPVGRLDMFSEGLLLMTDDGRMANILEHPSHAVEKEYLVRVEGDRSRDYGRLEGPVSLDGVTLTARVKLLSPGDNSTLLSVTITQGRNRQIRRMCQAVGMRVLKLKRIREGEITLKDLKPGQWRPLTQEELDYIRSLRA